MVRPPQTARSERTREALRQAALVRFLAQGVEATSAEQIAEDAGVSLRTFYRHFRSKHDLLFADYDAGLHWFRAALDARPADESIIDSVQAAIFSFPYDVDAVLRRCGAASWSRAGSSAICARWKPTSPMPSRPNCGDVTAISRVHPMPDCTSPSPHDASPRRCSARWKPGCLGVTGRSGSWRGSATSHWSRCASASPTPGPPSQFRHN